MQYLIAVLCRTLAELLCIHCSSRVTLQDWPDLFMLLEKRKRKSLVELYTVIRNLHLQRRDWMCVWELGIPRYIVRVQGCPWSNGLVGWSCHIIYCCPLCSCAAYLVHFTIDRVADIAQLRQPLLQSMCSLHVPVCISSCLKLHHASVWFTL